MKLEFHGMMNETNKENYNAVLKTIDQPSAYLRGTKNGDAFIAKWHDRRNAVLIIDDRMSKGEKSDFDNAVFGNKAFLHRSLIHLYEILARKTIQDGEYDSIIIIQHDGTEASSTLADVLVSEREESNVLYDVTGEKDDVAIIDSGFISEHARKWRDIERIELQVRQDDTDLCYELSCETMSNDMSLLAQSIMTPPTERKMLSGFTIFVNHEQYGTQGTALCNLKEAKHLMNVMSCGMLDIDMSCYVEPCFHQRKLHIVNTSYKTMSMYDSRLSCRSEAYQRSYEANIELSETFANVKKIWEFYLDKTPFSLDYSNMDANGIDADLMEGVAKITGIENAICLYLDGMPLNDVLV